MKRFGRGKVLVSRQSLRSTRLLSCSHSLRVSLLYFCETWTAYNHDAKVLSRFHLNFLRRIMKITWRDKIPGTPACWDDIPSHYDQQKPATVVWSCSKNGWWPKCLLYRKLATGKQGAIGQYITVLSGSRAAGLRTLWRRQWTTYFRWKMAMQDQQTLNLCTISAINDSGLE